MPAQRLRLRRSESETERVWNGASLKPRVWMPVCSNRTIQFDTLKTKPKPERETERLRKFLSFTNRKWTLFGWSNYYSVSIQTDQFPTLASPATNDHPDGLPSTIQKPFIKQVFYLVKFPDRIRPPNGQPLFIGLINLYLLLSFKELD